MSDKDGHVRGAGKYSRGEVKLKADRRIDSSGNYKAPPKQVNVSERMKPALKNVSNLGLSRPIHRSALKRYS